MFIGGSTEWKLSEEAAELGREAKRRGKWLHMGRVNSLTRLRIASHIGCDSVDGSKVAFAPREATAQIKRWLLQVEAEKLSLQSKST